MYSALEQCVHCASWKSMRGCENSMGTELQKAFVILLEFSLEIRQQLEAVSMEDTDFLMC